MEIIDSLFYKTDENTGRRRVSKTKLITCIVFLFFFVFALYVYIDDPGLYEGGTVIMLIASVLIGLIFAVPTFVVGWLIGKLLNRNRSTPSGGYGQNSSPAQTQNPEDTPIIQDFTNMDAPDCAGEFKKAIEDDNGDLAADLLRKWDRNDANYRYASIIFEGMPPSTLSSDELNELLSAADGMRARDESLREWFRSTAVQVISLHDEN